MKWRAIQYFSGRNSEHGFTLLELVVIVLLVGILGTMTTLYMKDMTDKSGLSRAAHQVLGDVRHCQEVAMTNRRDVFFSVDGNSYSGNYDAVGGDPVPSPSGGTIGVTMGTGDFKGVRITSSLSSVSFDRMGAPSVSSRSAVVTLNGKISIVIVPETGYTYID